MDNLIAEGVSEKQKALMLKHGTPAGLARSCYELVPGTISMDEAKAAVEKYQAEWDAAGDKLRMDYINTLPQPLVAVMYGGDSWPIEDIEVQTGLVRCDIVGKLQVYDIGDVKCFIDANGVQHEPESFYTEQE